MYHGGFFVKIDIQLRIDLPAGLTVAVPIRVSVTVSSVSGRVSKVLANKNKLTN